MKNASSNTAIVELHGDCLFVSDAHFRTPPDTASEERERKLVQLLINQEEKLQHLFLLGDILVQFSSVQFSSVQFKDPDFILIGQILKY